MAREPHEQAVALDCLRIAIDGAKHLGFEALLTNAEGNPCLTSTAARLYSFVTGEAEDDAKRKLSAVRETLNPS
ncbi:hypothetical protein FHW96_002839 [Novosphingobium sp. SG751A]|uniref:hypothetical protein n=1 Tax=Novosphingobium sp. SG751A TaxID=2587000 RepID=UPI0015559F6C|nr:hypothetical protein [Novosphingobium sp. SG751A]NOW46679.1 hypothetical protein [Novosphingobium sp. SG751A]